VLRSVLPSEPDLIRALKLGPGLTRRFGDDDQGLYEHEVSGLRSLCLYRSDALRSLPMGPEGSAAEQRRDGGRPQSYNGWDAGPTAKVWNARYQVDIQETHPGRSSKQEIEQGRRRPSPESRRPLRPPPIGSHLALQADPCLFRQIHGPMSTVTLEPTQRA